ncbi:hypothetical protein [Streptomyces sp. NPDC002328]|uniref:hypothetical protein n=1 Tax=Streptomyces sp. NPDC002328 TaxID=3364642 RepID=UPI003675E38C
MTVDKRFKQAARELAEREGISYTAARRRLMTGASAPASVSVSAPVPVPVPVPAHHTHQGWDEAVVASLSELVAVRGDTVPVRLIRPADSTDSTDATASADPTVPIDTSATALYDAGSWALAEPAADGWVIRELTRLPAAAPAVEKGTRVPVPYRTDDGRVAVAALWPLVWRSAEQPYWRWVHNGWSVERPGDLPEGLAPACPSAELRYEVRVYDVPDGIVGEDHQGRAPLWSTWAWCEDLDRAKEVADAVVAHRLELPARTSRFTREDDCGYVRAQVWRHAEETGVDAGPEPGLAYSVDADPARRLAPQLPPGTWVDGRPESERATPEPIWRSGEKYPPAYELKVFGAEGEGGRGGWRSLAWFTGGRRAAGRAAVQLRVGTGGRYAFAETWGPRFTDAWAQNWTPEGRTVADHHPHMAYTEASARYRAKQQATPGLLATALAARSDGALTEQQAADRLLRGGQAYRDFLTTGAACIADALHHARRDAQGTERLRIREALDALERHEVTEWVVDLTLDHLSTDPDTHLTEEARALRRWALEEYLAPDGDTEDVPGLSDTSENGRHIQA